MAKGPRAVTQSPKRPVQPEKSDDKEEEPTQNSSVAREEDDDTDDAEGDDKLEEDEESEDQRGVGVAEGPTANAGGMLQAGQLSNGTSYSIPFYNILISIGLTRANANSLFQEDIKSADNFATYINHEASAREDAGRWWLWVE